MWVIEKRNKCQTYFFLAVYLMKDKNVAHQASLFQIEKARTGK